MLTWSEVATYGRWEPLVDRPKDVVAFTTISQSISPIKTPKVLGDFGSNTYLAPAISTIGIKARSLYV